MTANAGVVVAGAVQTCRLVPGALYPRGTEMVLRRIWGFRLAFGVVDERSVFLAPRLSSPKSRRFAAVGSDTRLRAQPLRYALPLSCSRGGKSKGEGPQPLPFVSLGGVGETGEAPPVADEASLFRGSGAIGGPIWGRESQCRDGVRGRSAPTPPPLLRGRKIFLISPLTNGKDVILY